MTLLPVPVRLDDRCLNSGGESVGSPESRSPTAGGRGGLEEPKSRGAGGPGHPQFPERGVAARFWPFRPRLWLPTPRPCRPVRRAKYPPMGRGQNLTRRENDPNEGWTKQELLDA